MTMSEPHVQPDARLCALAGFLAERSVHTVVLIVAGTTRELGARTTDLPRELESIARSEGELHVPELDTTIRFTGNDIRCVSADPAISIAIMKALAAPHA